MNILLGSSLNWTIERVRVWVGVISKYFMVSFKGQYTECEYFGDTKISSIFVCLICLIFLR